MLLLSVATFLDALSGSPIEFCKRFVLCDGEQKKINK